ncbi:nucleotide exchange factor GrpE [archaeon]|nr:nucleotide exchange factor GrpE [Nanoarchaeota archaeon]MBU4300904.1 nucleotide exchange factor GrpE [Nanoarchaeota archaeon]MBU4451188.1 nucleotide exchange factor GrpE [Nanoarchaeota archaeon]MCG2723251.1 nucleotide exchange factor GrpE [archaeon]
MADEKKAKDEAPKKEDHENPADFQAVSTPSAIESKSEAAKSVKQEKPQMNEVDLLKCELAEKTKLAGENLNRLKYLQAEFDNFRKREAADRKDFMKFANHELIAALLNIVDDFERAIAAAKDEKDKCALQMVHKRFVKVLEEHGVKPIDALGKKFDAHMHEAFLSEESDKEEGIVLEELQKGYMLFDRVIRHSKVKVARNKEKE